MLGHNPIQKLSENNHSGILPVHYEKPEVDGGERVRHRDARVFVVEALLNADERRQVWLRATRLSIPNWSDWVDDPRRVLNIAGLPCADALVVGSADAAQALWMSLLAVRETWDEPLRVSQIIHTVTEVTVFEER